jgi:hypothetical protein
VYLNIGKSELMTTLVKPIKFSPDDRLAYIQSIRDVINLDVPVVVASGTIGVSPDSFFLRLLTIDMARALSLATRFLPTLRCLSMSYPSLLLAQLMQQAYMRPTVKDMLMN